MDLGWYLARLRNMGPAEIGHRIGERIRRRAMRYRQGWPRYEGAAAPSPLPGLREAVARADTAQRAAIAGAAAEILAGRFSALGRDWPQRPPDDLFPPGLWRLDPASGGAWPDSRTYCFDIDFRADPHLGDVKYVWEINRLQLLQPLAAAVLLGIEPEAAAAAIEAAVAGWHAANPPFGGVAWASGIEVALRALSLVVAITLAGDRLAAATHRQVGEILAGSRLWLRTFPSRHSSANNHRVAELAGLFVISLALGRPDPESRAELVDEVLRQILPDGVAAEQTPTYGAFTAELALVCAAAANAAGDPLPTDIDRRLGAFLDWIVALGDAGQTARIGDDDEGRALVIGTDAGLDYPRSVAAGIAGYLGTAGPETLAGDHRVLLWGRPAATARPRPGLSLFPQGGYSIWTGKVAGRRLHLVFDHGPLGYLSIAAHGHADALSLTLSVDGEPVLVDPGTYLYGSGGDWRRWFRGTPAHNTLNLEGQSQSLMAGPFNWSDKARVVDSAATERPRLHLAAAHDGYRRRFGVDHRRTIEATDDGLTVLDQLLGGTRRAGIVFQLAPGLDAAVAGAEIEVRRQGAPLLRLVLPTPDVTLSRGGDGPEGGWVSPAFGIRRPAWRIAWQGAVDGDGVLTRLGVGVPASAVGRQLDTQPAQT